MAAVAHDSLHSWHALVDGDLPRPCGYLAMCAGGGLRINQTARRRAYGVVLTNLTVFRRRQIQSSVCHAKMEHALDGVLVLIEGNYVNST